MLDPIYELRLIIGISDSQRIKVDARSVPIKSTNNLFFFRADVKWIEAVMWTYYILWKSVSKCSPATIRF